MSELAVTFDGVVVDPQSVLEFWIGAGPLRWFSRDDDFDAAFRTRFMPHHLAAAARKLDSWIDGTESALSLIILLDQFPRNAFRATAHMFATDPLARLFADIAFERGFHLGVDPTLAGFFFLPFMHSESLADQQRSVALYRDRDERRYAEEHYEIIRRFGRFPHRNAALGRTTTPEEQAFLAGGGFSG